MDDKVVPLRDSHPQIFKHGEPNEELVAKLEELLEMAKSGYLRAMSYVLITSDRAVITSWSGQCDGHDMTAGVSKLFYKFLAAETLKDE